MSTPHGSQGAINLPVQRTSFVGREGELASILDELRQPAMQLVTLTGPGGVGKTRLAERIAFELDVPAGPEVIWISLAALKTNQQVAQAIGQQFGLKGVDPGSLPDRLASTLLGRPVLMVLDNFEHLLNAAPMVAELLEACPSVTVLATSRGPLNITWEREMAIQSLPLPSLRATQPELEANAAVRLFMERALLTDEKHPVSLAELRVFASICRKLDGLPLAIELAAPWRRLLTADELLARLERPLPLLRGGPADSPVRQQSMSSAIEWSYALLDQDARRLFRELAIFPGTFTLEAAEFLAQAMRSISAGVDRADPSPGQLDILDALSGLVNQGIVWRVEHGFRMLQTVREYGLELLEERGELVQCGRAHLAWCISRTVEPDFDPLDGYLWGPIGGVADQADLTAALSFALDREDFESALRLAVALSPIWAEQGRYSEARGALERIRQGLSPTAAELRAFLPGWMAEWAWLGGDYAATETLARASLGASTELALPRAIAANRYRLGRVLTFTDPRGAMPLLIDALEAFRVLGDSRGVCWALVGLGHAALSTDDVAAARTWLDEADAFRKSIDEDSGAWLALATQLGMARLALQTGEIERAGTILLDTLALSRAERNRYFESLALSSLCEIYRHRQTFGRSIEAGRQGLQIAQALGHRYRERQCLIQLARAARDSGNLETAVLLDGGAAAIGAAFDFAVVNRSVLDELTGMTLEQEKRFAELEAAGSKLTGSELLALVMALELENKQAGQPASALSNRETEVLQFLAQGATNGEIAERLYVSRRTVDSHVGSILRKLQAASRQEAVATARKRGLVEPGDRRS